MEWISVKDRLPEFEQDVLLLDDWKPAASERRRDMKVGYLSQVTTFKTADGIENSCEWRGVEYVFNITHWMPLPEHPKE